jgi:hypothetical protein
MAIVRMANKREEIPAGASNVQDVSDRWRPAVDNKEGAWWTEERVKDFSLFTYETHNGLCLENRERNGYDDSDFYMIVWNPEKKAPESIEYASTRGWSYPCYGSYVDASPEVKEAYAEYVAAAERKAAAERAEREMKEVRKGKMVKVVRGRKVPVGTSGVCFWRGDSKFGERVGLKDSAGTVHWTALSNVEVVLNGPPAPASDEGAPWGGQFEKPEDSDQLSHRGRSGYCAKCSGECEYDSDGNKRKIEEKEPKEPEGAVLWDKREVMETKQSSWYDHTMYRVPILGKPDIYKFTSDLNQKYNKRAGSLLGSSVGGYCTLGSVKDNGDGTLMVEEIYHIGD